MQWTAEKINETYSLFKQRAAEDEQFRSLALSDPAKAVEQLTGSPLPESVRLETEENAQGELTIRTIALGERELDESELAAVTGGSDFAAFEANEQPPDPNNPRPQGHK